jgi:hypothetical protein
MGESTVCGVMIGFNVPQFREYTQIQEPKFLESTKILITKPSSDLKSHSVCGLSKTRIPFRVTTTGPWRRRVFKLPLEYILLTN